MFEYLPESGHHKITTTYCTSNTGYSYRTRTVQLPVLYLYCGYAVRTVLVDVRYTVLSTGRIQVLYEYRVCDGNLCVNVVYLYEDQVNRHLGCLSWRN